VRWRHHGLPWGSHLGQATSPPGFAFMGWDKRD
jgi:hypothetical protein